MDGLEPSKSLGKLENSISDAQNQNKPKGFKMPTIDLIVESHNRTVKDHIRLTEIGDYGLPEFQRTFVWDENRVLKLWESLHMGYPVGHLMFWEPENIDFPMRGLGKIQADLTRNAKFSIIDGQQRLTAILLVLKGEIPLYYDLQNEKFSLRTTDNHISLDILKGINIEEASKRNFFFLRATGEQQERFATQLYSLNSTFTNKIIPSQTIRYANYAKVVDIFNRVNEQGEPLTKSQIALARVSTKWGGVFRRTFDILKKLNTEMGFDRIEEPDFVALAWTAVHTGQHLIKHFAPEEGLQSKYSTISTREAYEESWSKLEKGINGLINLIRDRLCIDNFQFVKAYYPLIVVTNYFSHRDEVSEADKDRLTKWLLASFVQSRYTVKAFTKLREDIKAVGRNGSLSDLFSHRWALDPNDFVIDDEVLLNEGFKSSYSTLLYILLRKLGGADLLEQNIRVGDASIERWEYHHIFPKENFKEEFGSLYNRLEEAQQEGTENDERKIRQQLVELENRLDNIANLAFLTPSSNQSIGSKRPSDYLSEIANQPGGKECLKGQLI